MRLNKTILEDKLATFQNWLWTLPWRLVPSSTGLMQVFEQDAGVPLAKKHFALNAPWIWSEYKPTAGNWERRKFLWAVGQLPVLLFFVLRSYETHYIHVHEYWNAVNKESDLNMNLIPKPQKKINSEWKVTQIRVIADVFLWSRIWRNRANWTIS